MPFLCEGLEDFVLYRHLDNGKLWLRPAKMFSGKVTVKGKKVPRFVFIRAKKWKKGLDKEL